MEEQILKIINNSFEYCTLPGINENDLDEGFTFNMNKAAKEIAEYFKAQIPDTPIEQIRQAFEPIQMGATMVRNSDTDYLNSCIDAATPNLSKIKDVDQELAEIRGEAGKDEPIYTPVKILDWIQDGHAVAPTKQADLLNYLIAFVNHFSSVAQSGKDIREELIKFATYDALVNLNHRSMNDAESIVDDYLKSNQ